MTFRLPSAFLLLLLGTVSAGAAKPKTVKASSKAKPSSASALSSANALEAADRACTKDWLRGNVVAARHRCQDLEPSKSPVATYWRLALTDDPVELRKGLSAVALKEIEADPRLLLLAGRYQFSRGESRELSDLVWLANIRKLKGPQVDTLKRLSEGK